MALVRCRQCRREISAEEPTCPHCGIRRPENPTREENWASARDPRNLEPDDRAPFRFLLIIAVIFVVVAAALALFASMSTQAG